MKRLFVSDAEREYLVLNRGLIALCFVLCGMLALPMVPGWQGLARVTLGAVVLALALRGRTRPVGIIFGSLGALGLLLASISWIWSAATQPGRHLVGATTDIYGLALPFWGGLGLVVLDLALIILVLIVITGRQIAAPARWCFSFAVAMWGFSLLAPLSTVPGKDAEADTVAQMLAGSAEWGFWVILMALCLLTIREHSDLKKAVASTFAGSVAMACAMALQYAIGDFAYVLDASQFENYLFRMRGTAYYHAPATYTVGIGLLLLLGLRPLKNRNIIWWVALALSMAAIVAYNDSRALNLAMMLSATLFAIGAVLKAKYGAAFLAGVIVLAVGMDAVYIKPSQFQSENEKTQEFGALAKVISGDEPVDGPILAGQDVPAQIVSAEAVVRSNMFRVMLFQSGVDVLKSQIWVGSGVGTLLIPLQTFAFGGETYSSHMLYLDIALMAGVPALIAFLLMASVAGVAGLQQTFGRRQNDLILFALIAASVYLVIGGAFIPQERTNIVALFFVFSAMLALGIRQEPEDLQVSASGNTTPAVLAVFASLGAVLWAALTSSVYTLPAANLVARNAQHIVENQPTVYVMHPAQKAVMNLFLKMRASGEVDVRLLSDNATSLPCNNSYIIWTPALDHLYPKLRSELGYRVYRPGGDAPSLDTPVQWHLMPSIPYAGYLLYAGNLLTSDIFEPETNLFGQDTALGGNSSRIVDYAVKGSYSSSAIRALADLSPQSSIIWATNEELSLYFDIGVTHLGDQFGYSFTLPPSMTDDMIEEISWKVEGSSDLENWTLLDERENHLLTTDPLAPDVFVVSHREGLRYIRITFQETARPFQMRLSEVGLHTNGIRPNCSAAGTE